MSKFNYFFHILKSITGDVDDFADYFQYWVVKSTLMTLMTVFKPVLKNHMEHPTQQQWYDLTCDATTSEVTTNTDLYNNSSTIFKIFN